MPEIIEKGDWIDLCTAEDITLKAPYAKTLHKKTEDKEVIDRFRDVVFHYTIARLGVCMEMPEGYEALVVPRSSTFKKYGLIQWNSPGVIDNLYKSDDDEWGMPVIAFRAVTIPKGTRIAQFRIQLSQKATVWQKLKWLFSSGIILKKVQSLDNMERGGFGSTD